VGATDAASARRVEPKLVLLTVALAATIGTGAVLAATWNTFPGAWVKNRLGLSANKIERSTERATALLEPLGLRAPLERPHIVILKAARHLTLLDGDRQILTTRVGLGPSPEGPKRRQGDGRTPEGDYRICTRNDRSRFHLFLGLDYPSPRDADRGLEAGLISPGQHHSFVTAWKSARRPPWDTPLGGAVGIHGSGGSSDWTLGCIALDDPDIEVLWALCPIGTPVHIDP
jgi:hypothetical protein